MNIRSEGITYGDVMLVPKMGIVDSRKEIDISTHFGNLNLKTPIISAPMTSVTDEVVAVNLFRLGGLGVLHRNKSIENAIHQYLWVREKEADAAIAFGLHDGFERIKRLYNVGCRHFVMDIAHGHTLTTLRFLDDLFLRFNLRDAFVFVGSVATEDAVRDFDNKFGDLIAGYRVGIGPGAACTTRERTGFGVPQLSAVAQCVEATDKHIIADGGISCSGDIVKALAVGASSVMLGRLLAASEEAPHPGHYYGMASRRAKIEANNPDHFIEGVEAEIPVEGKLEDIINKLVWGIKSGVSYGGGNTLAGLRDNYEFVRVSHSTHAESGIRV